MTVIHSETPQPLDGEADIGISRHPSRADHKHGIDIDAIAARIAGDFATDAELAAEAQARSLADTEESLARVAADEAEEVARIAADAILQAALVELDSEKAPLASPALTGTPTAPTAAPDTSTTQIATTAFAKGEADAAQAAAIAASDPAGSAAAAVAAHVAAPDPHTQYTTAAEAAAAAPVQSVNTQTGAVVLTAADVGADPAGSAAAAQAAAIAASAPVAHVGAGGTAHAEATTSVAGFMAAADKLALADAVRKTGAQTMDGPLTLGGAIGVSLSQAAVTNILTLRNTSDSASAFTQFLLGNDTSAAAAFFGIASSACATLGGPNSLNLGTATAAPLTLCTGSTVRLSIGANGFVSVGGALSLNSGFVADSGDLGVARTSDTGAIYFGQDNTRYVYFDGTGFQIVGGSYLSVPASVIIGADIGGSEKLRVNGAGSFRAAGGNPGLTITGDSGGGPSLGINATAATGGGHWRLGDGVGVGSGLLALYDYANSRIACYYSNAGGWAFRTANTDRLSIDAAGGVVVGTDPGGSEKLRVGGGARIAGDTYTSGRNNRLGGSSGLSIGWSANDYADLAYNTLRDTSATQTYGGNDYATSIKFGSGGIQLRIAPSGSAGDAITWTTALGVSAAGVVSIPGTADGILAVSGKITAKAAVPASFADLAAVRTYLASILT
jgi:hypothetical protein